jgi:aspartate/methionine/tyrosine aminotransferase
LFEWLHESAAKTKYPLGFSNITGVSYEEFLGLTGFSIPAGFDLGIDHPRGASALSGALASRYGCACENIVTTSGGTEANFLVFSSLLMPGDEVIVEQPGYGPLWLTPQSLGARVVAWPRRFSDGFALDLDVLPSLISKKTKAIVVTNLHNPSGVLSSRGTLQHVADVAAMHGVVLVVDEIFLDGAPEPQPSAYGLPNTVITSSMSKVYGLGGLRTGWIVGPEPFVFQCQSVKSHTTGASSGLSEALNGQALGGARDILLERFKARTKENFGFLKDWMAGHPDLMEWVEPFGGTICFPRYHCKVPSLRLCREALESRGLLLAPGDYFQMDGHVRIGFGIEPSLFREGMVQLEGELRRWKNEI